MTISIFHPSGIRFQSILSVSAEEIGHRKIDVTSLRTDARFLKMAGWNAKIGCESPQARLFNLHCLLKRGIVLLPGSHPDIIMSETDIIPIIANFQVTLSAIMFLNFASLTFSPSSRDKRPPPRLLPINAALSVFLGAIVHHLRSLVPLYLISTDLHSLFSGICQLFCGCSFSIATVILIHIHHPLRPLSSLPVKRWIEFELITFWVLIAVGVFAASVAILDNQLQLNESFLTDVTNMSLRRWGLRDMLGYIG